ncbi:septum formation topological specificity factor MinE [Azospirillum lipoferum]|uniref:Uncharacterized protein n=1 Tax=Azospirillum lipoferum TaxID=193 RepID=A0A5A9GUF6_AZOLI|nr:MULTISPECIES: hypothetical protein [Azospirillum]KAA0598026.1 hypothetical protein FZ942_02710 [Azospirillum lipoferum]MCP1613864.1 septum formation topological specificity factor MinE [Azospirillum lipoferum]MDW5534683.1 hypothetical protein [Azospirillum sp. NL1]
MTSEMLLALFCIGATLLFLGIRRGLILRTEREIRRCGAILAAERDALELQANELEAMQAEIEAMKARLAELSTDKLALSRRSGKRTAATRRFIHEIGRPEPGRNHFVFKLAMAPGFAAKPDAKAVVHPAIWRFGNEAQVWASDFAAAQMLTRNIFHDGVGVTVSGEDSDDKAAAPAESGAGAP